MGDTSILGRHVGRGRMWRRWVGGGERGRVRGDDIMMR